MNCNRETLIAYILGDLDAEAERDLEAHIEQCPTCAARLTELRRTESALNSASEPEEHPIDMDRLWERIEREESAGKASKAKVVDVLATLWHRAAGIAAAAAFIILCFTAGISVRVGSVEVAFGPQPTPPAETEPPEPGDESPAIDEAKVRAVAHQEIEQLVAPALTTLAAAIDEVDGRSQTRAATLRDSVLSWRAADRAETRRNFQLMRAAVEDAMTIQPIALAEPETNDFNPQRD